MKWISVKNRLPDCEEDILVCDWLFTFENEPVTDAYRINVCESTPNCTYFCGEKTEGTSFGIKNSIAPEMGRDFSPYWMPIPNKNNTKWIKFDLKEHLKKEELYPSHKVLIRIHNENCYVAYIESHQWSVGFSISKYGDLESINYYMELPPPPLFTDNPKLSKEEERVKEEKSEAWIKKRKDAYEERRAENIAAGRHPDVFVFKRGKDI